MTVRLIIASAKYLIAKINSMLIRGNTKRIMYSVMAKQHRIKKLNVEVIPV